MKLKFITAILTGVLFAFSACSDSNKGETIILTKNDNTYIPSAVQPVLNNIQQQAFNFFYAGAEPTTGMILEGSDRGNTVTIGGTGFGVMALIVGSERAWITRSQAAERTLKIVNFVTNCERFQGAWAHWYNTDGSSAPFGDNQIKTADIVESAHLVHGLIAAKEYYTGTNATEKEISEKINNIIKSINWNFFTNNNNELYWLWQSEKNEYNLPIQGWNEGWMAYILALAAPSPNNISTNTYKQGWQRNGAYYSGTRSHNGYQLPLGPDKGGSLFMSQYSMLGLNPKQMADNQVNYWTQNVNHTMINRHYCVYEASSTYGYNEKIWGLTACYGAGTKSEYSARSPQNDDGVIAPTAALSAFPYTPFYSTQVLLYLNNVSYLKNQYGFGDSFIPSEGKAEKRVLAIDQGPIVVMIENYRTNLIWNLVMKNTTIQKGLELAEVSTQPNFDEGFHLAVINTKTNVYDMLIHPDRENYEIDYFVKSAGNVKFTILDKANKTIYEKTHQAKSGANILSFFDDTILRGKEYKINMETSSHTYSISVILR